jgi:hypothetical protein
MEEEVYFSIRTMGRILRSFRRISNVQAVTEQGEDSRAFYKLNFAFSSVPKWTYLFSSLRDGSSC